MGKIAFTQRQLGIDGTTLRYSEAGAGATVLCIDGIDGGRPSRAHEIMAERRRVIVVDPFDQPAPSPAAAVLAIRTALTRLEIDRFDLIGHGVGGALALHLAAETVNAAGSLTLLAPTALAAEPAWATRATAALGAALYAHPERQAAPPQNDALAARRSAALRLALETATEIERLCAITTPVLALFGTQDPLAPPEGAAAYRRAFADCNLMFVYDAAHALDVDRPEAVAYITLEFIERRDLFLVTRESGVVFP